MKDKLMLMYEDFLSQLAHTTHNNILTPSATATADNFNKATNVTPASNSGPISQPEAASDQFSTALQLPAFPASGPTSPTS
jgi:hypothetical protein